MLRYHYYIYNTHLFGILASVKKNNGDINNVWNCGIHWQKKPL